MTNGPSQHVDALFLRDKAALETDGAPPPEQPQDQEARDLAQLEGIQRWVESVLDRVPEAYGDRDKPEEIIDRWLDDLLRFADHVRDWRRQWVDTSTEDFPPTASGQALAALIEAADRIRVGDEEEDTDA